VLVACEEKLLWVDGRRVAGRCEEERVSGVLGGGRRAECSVGAEARRGNMCGCFMMLVR